QAFQAALVLQKALVAENPTGDHREDLARTYGNIAELCRTTRPGEAEEAFTNCLKLLRRLVTEYPEIAPYQYTLAANLNNQGNFYRDIGRLPQAAETLGEAIKRYEILWQSSPESFEYRHLLAASLHNRGIVHDVAREPEKAVADFKEALAIHEKLARDHP